MLDLSFLFSQTKYDTYDDNNIMCKITIATAIAMARKIAKITTLTDTAIVKACASIRFY